MGTFAWRDRWCNSQGQGIQSLTVEAYEVDANGLPTGAAAFSTTTDANGVFEFDSLDDSKLYCIKVVHGSEVYWLDGPAKAQVRELLVKDRLRLPGGAVVDSSGIPLSAISVNQMTMINEILGWPAYVPNGTDLVSGNLWLRKSGTMGAVTVVDVSGEAGLTDDYEQAIKALPAAANDAIEWLPWIYANEPRVKAGKTISAMFAVWCVGGVGVTAKLVNSDASETTAPAVNTAEWNIVTIEGHTLAGTSCKPQFVADDAGTFYVVPLGACIGPRAMALPPRTIRYVVSHGQDAVILDVDAGGTWVDADLTSKTSPLAVAVLGVWAYQNNTTNYVSLKVRAKGATNTGNNLIVVKAHDIDQYWVSQAMVPCSDGQTIQLLGGAAEDVEKIGLYLTGYWEWA